MITSAQHLNPNRARLWLPLDGMWRQDVGANLVVDGDMEAVGTGAYTAVNAAILSKQPDPYAGLQCLHIAYNGVATPGARQMILTAGYTYAYEVAMSMVSGSGSANFNFGAGTIRTTSLLAWQFYTGMSTGATVVECLVIGGTGTARYDSLSVKEAPLTTRNLGGMPGAPTYARLGDGHTASTVPNQRTSSRGISLDGGDYVRVPMDFEYNEPFTISILTDSILPAASWLAATYDSATLRGIRFGTTGSGALVAGIFDTGGRSITLTSANNTIPTNKQPRLYTLSYDGGLSAAGLTMRIDDMVVPAVGGGTALASSISSGRDLLLGARWNAATPTEIMAASNVYAASSFDTVLDSYEIRMLRAQMMREVRV